MYFQNSSDADASDDDNSDEEVDDTMVNEYSLLVVTPLFVVFKMLPLSLLLLMLKMDS